MIHTLSQVFSRNMNYCALFFIHLQDPRSTLITIVLRMLGAMRFGPVAYIIVQRVRKQRKLIFPHVMHTLLFRMCDYFVIVYFNIGCQESSIYKTYRRQPRKYQAISLDPHVRVCRALSCLQPPFQMGLETLQQSAAETFDVSPD
jgi:hypothetical protein